MLVSIVIRTLNESRHLDDLLTAIDQQKTNSLQHEIVLVDSGSTDGTLEIARRHGCNIHHINRSEFSFGRSLNIGCARSKGDILVFISGHCVPADSDWLENLCRPIIQGHVAYSYGRQIGDDDNNFSERRIFTKYFPGDSSVPQDGIYCNNANSALKRSAWEAFPFNEELTGLEDMELAKRLTHAGEKIGYVAKACVFHHHDEDWATVRRRFEREAIALQRIMPEVHLSRLDMLRYIACSVWMDWRSALRHGQFIRCWRQIIQYRVMQYLGSYLGNHEHRRLSQKQKDVFFYPSTTKEDDLNGWLHPHRRVTPDEGEQRTRQGKEFS
jgi:rhamnosyltransferase